MKSLETVLMTFAGTLLLFGTSCLAAQSQGTIDPVSGKPCYTCHRSKVNAPKIHDALAGNDCSPCHPAVGGDHQKNHELYAVKDKSAKLCWGCHDSVADQKSVHPIISAEGCLGCHAPHNSSLRKLLRAEPPELCFGCHERALVAEPKSGKATDFRDGVQNLHYLHAGGENPIPCLVCHDMHASSQEHLIRTKGSNGKEAVTIAYTATEKGGSCTASCHDALSYQRK